MNELILDMAREAAGGLLSYDEDGFKLSECPQFRGWDDDTEFSGYGEFGKIPRKGLYRTVQFWREWGHLLWESGYDQALPEEVKELFDNIDQVIDQAVKNYCKTL